MIHYLWYHCFHSMSCFIVLIFQWFISWQNLVTFFSGTVVFFGAFQMTGHNHQQIFVHRHFFGVLDGYQFSLNNISKFIVNSRIYTIIYFFILWFITCDIIVSFNLLWLFEGVEGAVELSVFLKGRFPFFYQVCVIGQFCEPWFISRTR